MVQIAAQEDGFWLTNNVQYREVVKKSCASEPRLRQRDKKLVKLKIPWPACYAKVAILEVEKSRCKRYFEVTDPDSFQQYLDARQELPDNENSTRQTIYIIEGLNSDLIGILGNYFNLPPLFFLEQERSKYSVPGARPLPSIASTRPHISLRYGELLNIPPQIQGNFSALCSATGRNVSVSRSNGTFSDIGIVTRTCSIWNRHLKPGGWDCVVLCDPPVRTMRTGNSSHEFPVTSMPSEGEYSDFLPYWLSSSGPPGPPRTSMMQDLLFYLLNYSGCIGIDDPCTVLLFALKIVASKFVVLIEYFDRMVNQSHRYMSRQSDLSNFAIAKVEAQWSDVQSLLRRTRKWRDALEGIITQLPVPKDLSTMSQVADWKDYHMDFQLLSQRLNSLCHSAEMLNMSITGLAGMAGNRQASEEQKLSLEATKRSIQEARSAKTLTMFGLVFIPLAYTASLFSMADPYGPGKDEFGSYFIVSFPLVTCVIAAYYVVDFGYTQDGRSWSFNNLVIALRKLISGLVERDAS